MDKKKEYFLWPCGCVLSCEILSQYDGEKYLWENITVCGKWHIKKSSGVSLSEPKQYPNAKRLSKIEATLYKLREGQNE